MLLTLFLSWCDFDYDCVSRSRGWIPLIKVDVECGKLYADMVQCIMETTTPERPQTLVLISNTLGHIDIFTPSFGESICNYFLDIHIILLDVLPIPEYQLCASSRPRPSNWQAQDTHFKLASYFASTAVNRFRRLLIAFFKHSTADRPSDHEL